MEAPPRFTQLSPALWWAIPVGVAFLARAIACFAIDLPWDSVDTRLYGWMARAILDGEPVSYAPNGYPLFLAFLLSVLPAPTIVPVIQSFNVLWGTATVGLTYAVARTLDRPPIAGLAATIVAVYPHQINYSRFLLTEVPTTLLLMLSMYMLIQAQRHSNAVWSAASGMAIGLAMLLRTALGPVAVGLALLSAKRGMWMRVVLPFVLGLAMVLGAHGAAVATGSLAPSSNLHLNLRIAIAADPEAVILSEPRLTDAERASAIPDYLRHARENPVAFIGQRFDTAWNLWSPWPRDPGSLTRPVWQNLLLGLRFPLLLLGLVGLVIHRRNTTAWVLAFPALATTAVYAFFFALPRFTFIAEPGLAILTALALAAALRRIQSSSPPASS